MQGRSDIIVAQCTPSGAGAVALVRLSGDGVFSLLSHIARIKGLNPATRERTILFGYIIDEKQEEIDQALFLIMPGPNTFTGEDVVEITCHNNQIIIETIIATAIAQGARAAFAGEFTQRACVNGRIDLMQAESIHELVAATSVAEIKQALSQIKGSLSSQLFLVEEQLMKVLMYAQASFEFIEEEQPEFGEIIRQLIKQILQNIESLLEHHHAQQRIRTGLRVALIGSVNAGKSSLFNKLLAHDRAIVSDIPGTTRDTIEAGVFKGGFRITYIDTAGIRKTENLIEQLGIERSHDEAVLADLILLIVDSSSKISVDEIDFYKSFFDQYQEKIVVVLTKSDLAQNNFVLSEYSKLSVSCAVPESIKALEFKITQELRKRYTQQTSFLINNRQYQILCSVLTILRQMLALCTALPAYELIATEAIRALELCGEMTGKTVSEASMDTIFRHFCVGK